MIQARAIGLGAGLFISVAAISLVALALGPYPLSASAIMHSLLRLDGSEDTVVAEQILWQVRLPRLAAALMVGAALAAAGAAYQALFRNPLVSPDILGVSAGAGLGAVFGIFLSLPVLGIQLMAFVGGLGAVGLVGLVAGLVRRGDRTLVLVLTGIVVGALAGAATSLIKVLADPYDQLPAITFWLLGSLAAVMPADILPAIPAVVLGLLALILMRWRINVLGMGDEEARALGIEAGRIRAWTIIAATLITASVTAIAGVVGWVGLVIPHIGRMLVGPGFGRLLPVCCLIGAGYLVVVDTLARTIAQTEVPLGILTAVIGAPFFIALLARGRQGWS